MWKGRGITMKHGFIKTAAVTPTIRVADPAYNARKIMIRMKEATEHGAKIMVFPELCLSGYSCGDLFAQDVLLNQCREQLRYLVKETAGSDGLVFIGLPFEYNQKLYNVAAAIQNGRLLALIPKRCIPTYGEFYEGRYFVPGTRETVMILFDGEEIPFGSNIILAAEGQEHLKIACEICEDLWAPMTPGTEHAAAGATVIVNLSASNEVVGKDSYRELLVRATSSRLVAGYIYSSAGEGESTQDVVYGGHSMIAENGHLLAVSKRFENQTIYCDLDVHRLAAERRRMNTFEQVHTETHYQVFFALEKEQTQLEREFARLPFVPGDEQTRQKRCEEILTIQAMGLKKRYKHTKLQTAVLGLSGGLDSTLALLVTVKAFDLLKLSRENIYGITMPCFGTTDRTYDNSCKLAAALGVTLKDIPIREAVTLHLKDIDHDPARQDVTYENAQARERTQVLMDYANKVNGLVIGTGDMSELALGWATYNGDHMSMYGVNAGVPKTLVRHLVQFYGDTCQDEELAAVLSDILDTPVSPELLPPVDGRIAQKTENLVGPYELHDFFLYYMLRCCFEPAKIYRLALQSFAGVYEKEEIVKWIKVFYQRFFAQQFKRSCLPDGPKVGSVAISPRGDLRMPSDAAAAVWLKQLEEL